MQSSNGAAVTDLSVRFFFFLHKKLQVCVSEECLHI